MQALLDGGPDALRHHVARRASVDDDAALRLLIGERAIGRAQRLMKFDRLALEAVGCALPRRRLARARPTVAGTSRMKVRSGMAAPTVTRSRLRISLASTLPSAP